MYIQSFLEAHQKGDTMNCHSGKTLELDGWVNQLNLNKLHSQKKNCQQSLINQRINSAENQCMRVNVHSKRIWLNLNILAIRVLCIQFCNRHISLGFLRGPSKRFSSTISQHLELVFWLLTHQRALWFVSRFS